ncbi:MAG: hypothetical protein NTW79_03915 [Candidatus Berkelbacteria bacterium]|nr:hypothetical protein [Candidatus Berkelbacteria bacterium]
MGNKIIIEISARHIHLSKTDYDFLFAGEEYKKVSGRPPSVRPDSFPLFGRKPKLNFQPPTAGLLVFPRLMNLARYRVAA